MRIMHIVEAFTGGVFTFVADLANSQCGENEVYIVHGIRPTTHENYKDYFDKKISFIQCENFRREISIASDLKACIEIKSIVQQKKPDIIHLHSTKAGAIGRLAVNVYKYSLIYSPHAYSFLLAECSGMKRTIYKILESFLGRKKCLTVADSESEYRQSKKVTKNAVYIDNGIDVEELQDIIDKISMSKPQNEKPVYYMIGRICKQKNPELFNSLAQKFPDNHFIWIGEGELEDTLISPNIEVTGWLSREDAIKQVMSADVFLFPTLYESLAITLLEAMYMKKLCIVSDADGNRDVINQAVNGYKCLEEEEYIEILRKINEGTLKTDKIVENARNDILQKYNTKMRNKKYMHLMLKLMEK